MLQKTSSNNQTIRETLLLCQIEEKEQKWVKKFAETKYNQTLSKKGAREKKSINFKLENYKLVAKVTWNLFLIYALVFYFLISSHYYCNFNLSYFCYKLDQTEMPWFTCFTKLPFNY